MTKVIKKMEKITLYRYGHSKDSIYGNINIHTQEGNVITLQTVENKDKAIKKGTYNINHSYSPKFDTNLWTLTVPNRTGIRIHIANRGDQLSGCIALGLFKMGEQVYQSKKAISLLHTILNKYKTYQIEII